MSFGHTTVYQMTDKPIVMIRANRAYIPMHIFLNTFWFVLDHVKSTQCHKVIFDERRLQVFHGPSLEWYYLVWKEKMYELGVNSFRSLLPLDPVCTQSVEICISKIASDYPEEIYQKGDLKLVRSLKAAIED